MLIINIITSLLFIIAAFSDSVSPDRTVFFSYLGLLFPLFILSNVIFLIYWLVLRKWMFLFIAVCSFLICWKPVSCYVAFHPFAKSPPQHNTIKLLTYNVMAFGYKNHTADKPNPVLQYIADSKADIVCMQEYMEGRVAGTLTQEKIAGALSMYPYHYSLPLIRYNKYTIGLAIYSKYPILRSWKVRYDSAFNGSTVHELNVNGKSLIIVNNHLESFKLTMKDRSTYSDFITNMNSDTFEGLSETVRQKVGSAFYNRAEQADIVAEEIGKLNGDYIVACGDFNDTPISYAHRTIQGKMIDAFAESGNGMGISYNRGYFWFRIDHIIHSANMRSYKATVEKLPFSDHNPMWCYLEMK